MKNIILFVLSVFCISANGQNHQVDNFRTSLSHYETLCKQLLEEIEYIKKHDKELNMKAEPKTRVMNLVINITKDIKSNDTQNKRFHDKLKELKDSLCSVQPKSTVTPTTEVSSPVQNPDPIIREENPIEAENDDNTREVNVENPDSKPLRDVRGANNLDNYLSLYTLAEIYEYRDEVKKEMSKYNNPKKKAYTYIIELFEIQYHIYNKNHIKDLLARISTVQADILDKHKSELEDEIIRVNDYRYATKELQRLFDIIDNPPSIGTDSTRSKWDEDRSIDIKQLKQYLESKNETEYVYKFDYTKQQFNAYLNANAAERDKIKSDIAKVLAN
ncbi:MAG: hypothetical protein LUD00_05320 [Prevotellaceae bacterium]|nr:hypothetical protein [Prevotellaceae bacterium]